MDNGTQSGLNETNILMGDIAVQQIVGAIKQSRAWHEGENAIVLLWDENDYTATPNRVLLVVDTNYGVKGVQSNTFYTHFSLLKSLEAGFGLPYLNHACDDDQEKNRSREGLPVTVVLYRLIPAELTVCR